MWCLLVLSISGLFVWGWLWAWGEGVGGCAAQGGCESAVGWWERMTVVAAVGVVWAWKRWWWVEALERRFWQCLVWVD